MESVVRRSARQALGPCLAVAFLAGCSGLPAAPDGRPAVPAAAGASRNDGAKSWMAADAKTKDLLYVTAGTIDVYSYPQGQLEGQLTGLSLPYGDCTDKKGDVYVTDYKENTVVEYAHGVTQPIRTLPVPGSGPYACAVDPASGNLAVTTAGDVSGGGANVAVYRKASGTPKTYTDREISGYAYCTYDNAGDLFVDGIPAHGYGYDYELAKLPRRAKSLKAVTLEYGLSWSAGLQWNRGYLAVGQPIRPYIVRYAISGRNGTYAGSTPLTDAYEATQFIIAGSKAIVTNEYYFDRYIVRWDVLVFNYPAGGGETEEIVDASAPVYSVALSRRHN